MRCLSWYPGGQVMEPLSDWVLEGLCNAQPLLIHIDKKQNLRLKPLRDLRFLRYQNIAQIIQTNRPPRCSLVKDKFQTELLPVSPNHSFIAAGLFPQYNLNHHSSVSLEKFPLLSTSTAIFWSLGGTRYCHYLLINHEMNTYKAQVFLFREGSGVHYLSLMRKIDTLFASCCNPDVEKNFRREKKAQRCQLHFYTQDSTQHPRERCSYLSYSPSQSYL